MQAEIYSIMYRMIHKYGWNWGITRGLINRRFGTNYTCLLYTSDAADDDYTV